MKTMSTLHCSPFGLLRRGNSFGRLLLAAAMISSSTIAQAKDEATVNKNSVSIAVEKKVTGVVKDATGSLPGATVVVKGTAIGTITDFDGNFSLDIPEDATTLVVSFVGLATTEIVLTEASEYDVFMEPDAIAMDDVIVTALGIKRETKSLGYAVQEVKTEDLNRTGDGNMTSALSGKVAGVQINQGSGGAGSNSRIEIRGVSSLGGNDAPLWVVDGVPFDDGNSGESDGWGGTSRASGSFELNPDDIESISVLKGPNAAALYGERGGNGVIMVTTKQGKKGTTKVTYSGNVTVSDIAYMLDYQDRYGQGKQGVYDPLSTSSWGTEMDGSDVESWTGETTPYTSNSDLVDDFTRVGVSQKHSVALSGGSESGSYRLSLGKDMIQGIYEDNEVEKTTIDLRAGYQIKPWLKVDSKLSYFETTGEARPEMGAYSYMSYFNTMPRSIRTEDLDPGYIIEGGEHKEVIYGTATAGNRNPYFLQEQWHQEDRKNRTFGYVSGIIDIIDGLKLKGKYGLDTYRWGQTLGYKFADNVDPRRPNYKKEEIFFIEQNWDYLLSYDKKFNDDWAISVSAGGAKMNRYSEGLTAESGKLATEADFFLGNGTEKTVSESISEMEIRSIYGFGQVAYKNYLFLDLTYRRDYSSTLTGTGYDTDAHYDYPSVSLSGVMTDIIDAPQWLDFWKIRGSWAKLGKGTDPYAAAQNYTVSSWNYNLLNTEVPNISVDPTLESEKSTSWEIGTDFRVLNNRIGVDFTYYDETTDKQIMPIDVDQTTGYEKRLINAGEIKNRGVEFMLKTVPIKTRDFTLNADFNFAKNRTVIKELTSGVEEYVFGDLNGGVELIGLVDETMGQIRGSAYTYDTNGNKIVGSDGRYLVNENQILGDVQADFTGSFNLNADYKGLYVSALFSFQKGGDIVSITEQSATAAGTAERTDYMDRMDLFADGVQADGSSNTALLSAQDYWGSVSNIDEEFLYDASFLKLKELAIGYSIPSSVLNKINGNPISSARFSAVGRNLFYLVKHTPGTTPDGSAYNTSFFAKAVDYAPAPAARNFGFSLNLSF